ncbi:KELC-like protein [Mya arenaria]|uniref:KELC-like protein n=1 Tax=Mya arenaria TaxID=6604 RepID=A0ABY7DW19_MYAAR|nr:KELC-like protein [Mya arenaria]
MTEDYYTIQTQDHASTMLSDMFTLQKQGVMCDVILSAEDGEVMAHKVVLMAASKYFREKLSPVVSQRAAKICLKGISVVELANLVKYIYTGKLLVAKETMDITLEISEILELNGVIQGYNEIVSYETMKEKEASQTTEAGQAITPEKKDEAIKEALSKPISGEDGHLSQATSVASEIQNSGLKLPVITSSPSKPVTTKTIEATQTVASEYNFEVNPYEEQYVDVTVGSKTPTKDSNQTQSIPIVTPPRLQQMVDIPTEGPNITAEEAQHQDLLAVAIESLTDGSNMINRQKQGPEIERAVSSITPKTAPENVVIEKVNVDVEVGKSEDFINGKTCTKTLTMNAGKVNNEYGGQTEVYTVSLDPSTLKSPIIMPRKMKKRTSKEKKAEEAARTYRKKKNELLQTQYPIIPIGTVFDDAEGQQQIPIESEQQDFRFASLSKLRKKNQISENSIATNLNLECDEIIAGRDSFILSNDTAELVVEQESVVSSTSDIANAEGIDEATRIIKSETDDHTPSKSEQGSPKTPLKDDEKSSATKRKTRTPKKIALSDAETDSSDDKRRKTNIEGKVSMPMKDDGKIICIIDDEESNVKGSKTKFSAKETVPQVLQPKVRLKRHTDSEVDELVKKVKKQGQSPKGKVGQEDMNEKQNAEIQVDIESSKVTEGSKEVEDEDPFNEVMKNMNVELHKAGRMSKRQRKAVKRPDFEYDQQVAKKSKVTEYACQHDGCKALFKSVGELMEHQKTCSNKGAKNLFKLMKNEAKDEVPASPSKTIEAFQTKLVELPIIITHRNIRPEEKQSGDEQSGSEDKLVTDVGEEPVDKILPPKEETRSPSPASGAQKSDAWSQYGESPLTDKDLYRCNYSNCQTLADNLGCLKLHYAKFHKKRWDSGDEIMFQKKLKKLDELQGAISSDPAGSHIRTEVLYKCVACNMTSIDVKELDIHLADEHEGAQEVPTSILPLKCSHCPNIDIKDYEALTKHLEEVHDFVILKRNMPDKTNNGNSSSVNKTGRTRKRISLNKLPTEEFTHELLRRHQEYLKKPEKKYKFMSSVLAKNTLMPSFPQASPSIRNTTANKLYNMPKFSPKYTPITDFPGLGQLSGQLSGPWVPRVGSEVVVEQHHCHHGEVVIENVAGDPRVGSTILKLVSGQEEGEEQMIMITTNGIQSVVRSKDFYQTLLESGNESAQTLKVISTLLEAGEEIEIREEGEQVEIQNI